MNTPEVISIGEAFIDLVSSAPTTDLSTARSFIKIAGGAPANVAVGLAKLGIKTAFLGKVGRDSFGRFVKNELKRNGVDIRLMIDDPNYKTRLAFVAVTEKGGRDFEFWENDPADQHLLQSEIDLEIVSRAKVINIGPFLLLNTSVQKTAFAIARYAQKMGIILCFDPNIRMSLWSDPQKAVKIFLKMIRLTTILRLNEDEAKYLTGSNNLNNALSQLLKYGPKLVVITRDKKGCTFATKEFCEDVKGFPIHAVDTTGCGDGFLAGLLAGLLRSNKQIDDLTRNDLRTICVTANAVGAMVATKRGAIAAMPTLKRLQHFLRRK